MDLNDILGIDRNVKYNFDKEAVLLQDEIFISSREEEQDPIVENEPENSL